MDLMEIVKFATAGVVAFNLLYISNKTAELNYLCQQEVKRCFSKSPLPKSPLHQALAQHWERWYKRDYNGFAREELTTFPTFSSWYENLKNITS